ncbi:MULTISPECIES: hypothetical protein [Kitasatospora]|uniref:Uncharacterized protein n=1 Tax=Kitasatospora setae (strain ATCC 33774 / DSM 43861 / JCM 3304 / KCC A-0304 / NBRC 14216 / KM-6054) TaxID=452652 RepID=E4NIT0_KITSK|nr:MULTISPECIES: hypothetical protein [Kitasatospora]BAJ32878.1 hypothetical protein KSE_71220 [Kitasatospora setae KM-6054]
MEALTGGYRVYFTAVWILFAAELLCLAATAPPLRLIAPVWLWAGLAGAVGLLLAAAVLRCMLLPFPRHGGWFDPVLYVWHLPRGLKVWYGIALCLVGIGLATAGGAEDVRKDAAGYYLEHHDTRTPLTRDAYEAKRGALVRLASGIPAGLCVIGSFLVLLSGDIAYGADEAVARPRPGGGRRSEV